MDSSDAVHLIAKPDRFVSRAGQKLEAALEAFNVDVEGVQAIDVGASTGGFTDCLLSRGAASVTALDVGYGQMHWRIRTDVRVRVIERTNIRTADLAALGAPFELVVVDLSFISLRTVREQLAEVGSRDATWIFLIKPQFEAGRERIDRGGIVRDGTVRLAVISDVIASFDALGLGCAGLIESPVTGARGNVEYLAIFKRGSGAVIPETIEAALDGTVP